jgi:hypothetical protein
MSLCQHTGFIVDCNFSVTLKKHSFPGICLYEILPFLCEEPTLEVCTNVLDTSCIVYIMMEKV